MKILLKILILLAIVIGLGGFLVPADWEVTRSIVIDAQPAAIHAQLDNLRNWEAWSPFDKEDPEMVVTYDKQVAGVNAHRSWKSEEMGDGNMTIVKSDPAKGVEYDIAIDGFSPFKGEFSFEQVDGGTKVTWRDWGNMGNNPLHRWMALLMESMMGSTFETGLADLKRTVEAS